MWRNPHLDIEECHHHHQPILCCFTLQVVEVILISEQNKIHVESWSFSHNYFEHIIAPLGLRILLQTFITWKQERLSYILKLTADKFLEMFYVRMLNSIWAEERKLKPKSFCCSNSSEKTKFKTNNVKRILALD